MHEHANAGETVSRPADWRPERELASVGRLSDAELLQIRDLAIEVAGGSSVEADAMLDFCAELVALVEVERELRLQEVRELERLYFRP